MKSLKTASILLATAIFATGLQLRAQDIPSAPVVDANKDRSYVADYADKKANLVMVDETGSKETPMSLKTINDKGFVFVDSSGGELVVPKKSKSFKFILKPDSNWPRARAAYAAGDWNEAIAYMRPMVYPLLDITGFSEDAFRIHAFVEMYITALVNANKLNEAYAMVSAMPISDVPPSLLSSCISVASALASEGRSKEAVSIVEKISFNEDNMAAMSDMMDLLAILRKHDQIKACALAYTKLANLEGNPFKNEAMLWMVYCDLRMGNKLSAEVYLSSAKIERGEEAFSLMQMIKGMMKAEGEKPNLPEALDLYAEGIVFGTLSSPWMPELLFNTGMAYKKINKPVASNEIFTQIAALYPDDPLAAKGMKEIVKVEKKAKKNTSGDEDDEDEDE